MKKIGALVIVFSVLFTITIAPIFADTIPNYSPVSTGSGYIDNTNNHGYYTYRITSLNPYIETFDISTINYSNYSYMYNMTFKQDYVVLFTLQNTSNAGNIYIPNPFIGFQMQAPATTPFPNKQGTTSSPDFYNFTPTTGWDINNISGDISGVSTVGTDNATSNKFRIMLSTDYYNAGNILLPERYKAQGSFVITKTTHVQLFTNVNYTINSAFINNYIDAPASSITFDNYTIETNSTRESHLMMESLDIIEANTSQIYNSLVTVLSNQDTIINNQTLAYAQRTTTNNLLTSIDSNVQAITDAYTSNASNVTETQDNISDTQAAEQQLHQRELSFYQQNEQALQNVGISNFSFSSDQSSGLGSVITDFTTLWNNIGPLQIIFTFTLSMSLATFLLRHRPITGAIKKNQKR